MRCRFAPGPAGQRGIALLLVVAILVLGSAFLIIDALNAATWRADRYRVTQDALIKAKEALIAYAVADPNRPGELPCPDVNDDGQSEPIGDYSGSNCKSLIGRLPWITLGIPELRDAAGEHLWYALSNDFHANGSTPLNNDTAYLSGNSSLMISGTQPAANVVAIVFSPGAALIRAGAPAMQDRSCTGGSCNVAGTCTSSPASATPKCNSVNYLDVLGIDNASGGTTFVSAAESSTFNDRLLPVYSDDIMSLVQKRAGSEYAQKLREHYDAWQTATGTGFYPWAAPFVDPTSTPAGTSGTLSGLLPSSATAALSWGSASAGCSGVGTNQITCSGFVWPGIINFLNFSGTISNIGSAFFNAPAASDVTIVSGITLIGSPTPTWTVSRAAQTLNFSYSAPALSIGLVTIRVRVPTVNSWTTSSWLTTNNWFQDAYYAVSPGYAISGSSSCGGAGPQCIAVNGTAAPNNNKEAVVITTGRALPLTSPPQAARPVTPPAALSDFLEGENQTPADLTFQEGIRTPQFNDYVTVVRP